MAGRWIIDRIEEGTAVLVRAAEARQLPARALPAGAREGDVLVESPAGLELDPAASAAAREDARRRLERLHRTDPGGDLEL